MDVSVLDIFVDVMNKGSFAAVARDRNVDPSSISRAIGNLEKQLGARLFQRTTRKISPTDAALKYYSRIVPLMQDLRLASETIHEQDFALQGTLRITSSVSFGQHVLMPILQRFMDEHPELVLDFVLTDRNLDIIEERIDVAVRHGSLSDSSFVATKLMDTRYRVVASPEYFGNNKIPQMPEELADYDVLVLDIPQFRAHWSFEDDKGETKNIKIKPRYIISNALILRNLALNWAGISLLADWLVKDELKAGRLIELFPEYRVRAGDYDSSIHLITPSRSYMPQKIRKLIGFFKVEI